METGAYLRELALLRFLFLSVIVAGKPPCGVITSHSKLSVFVLDDKIHQRVLLWELIAQTHTYIINAESDGHLALGSGLREVHGHLVVVVSDLGILSPDGSPRLVES